MDIPGFHYVPGPPWKPCPFRRVPGAGLDASPDRSSAPATNSVDARLAEIKINDPDASDQVLAAIFGPENAATNWHTHFRTWRKRRLREIEVEYGDRLDEVAEFLAEFASKIKALGPASYLRSTSHRAGEDVLIDKEE